MLFQSMKPFLPCPSQSLATGCSITAVLYPRGPETLVSTSFRLAARLGTGYTVLECA